MKNIFKLGASKIRNFNTITKMKAKKHAPELLVGAGIVLTGAAIVVACKQTMKVGKILETHKSNLEKVNTAVEEKKTFIDDDGIEKTYTVEIAKMDKFVAYRDTTFAFAKTYAIPAGLFILGMTCFVTSTVILKKREAAALALFNGSLAAFNAYRSRVREAVGEEAESNIYHDIRTDGVKGVFAVDKNGNKTPVNGFSKVGMPHNVYTFSMNSQTCRFWEKDMRYNLAFAKSIEKDIDDMVFGPYGGEPVDLNTVLKKLGMLKCGAMMGEGWVPEKLGGKVNHVSFGLEKYSLADEFGGVDIMDCDDIKLEFNCEHIMDKF